MKQITEKYKAYINQSEDMKRKLQKEWADEEAAHSGKVVQGDGQIG
jgi:hypothetical protein